MIRVASMRYQSGTIRYLPIPRLPDYSISGYAETRGLRAESCSEPDIKAGRHSSVAIRVFECCLATVIVLSSTGHFESGQASSRVARVQASVRVRGHLVDVRGPRG